MKLRFVIGGVGKDDQKGMVSDDLAVGRTEPLNLCTCGVIPSKLDIRILSGISVLCFALVFIATQSYAARIASKNPMKEEWGCKVLNNQWICSRSCLDVI